MRIVSKTSAAADRSRKYLFELDDGKLVESVYLPDPRFFGVCVSTQVGCNMGCHFCATAQQRAERNLTTEEIVGQATLVKESENTDLRFDFVTLAGMGEPLANYKNSVQALAEIKDRFSSVTVASLSTIGFPDKFQRLIDERRDFRVYLSLHATTDLVRRKLIPMAEHYAIADLVDCMGRYGDLWGSDRARISYLLLKGVNDSDQDLDRLRLLLRGKPVMLQLLFLNEVAGMQFERTDDALGERWIKDLRADSIDAYKMPSMGRSITAACGQLVTRRSPPTPPGVSIIAPALP